MTYEELPRNKKTENKRVAKATAPLERYRQARREHLQEMRRLLREIRREFIKIRAAKLAYKLEK